METDYTTGEPNPQSTIFASLETGNCFSSFFANFHSFSSRFLFASAAQYTVQIYDLQTRELVNDFREETQQITSLAMSADSTMLLLTVVKSAEIHLWSVRDISNPVLVRKFCGAVQEKSRNIFFCFSVLI
jgi:hypothetical protein